MVHEEENEKAKNQSLSSCVDLKLLAELRRQLLRILHDFKYFQQTHEADHLTNLSHPQGSHKYCSSSIACLSSDEFTELIKGEN